MGNKLISPLKNTLKKYFNDIDDSKVNLTIFNGHFKLENLHMNNEKINEELEINHIPLKVKFGMLSKMEAKVSILKAKLEYIDIEDMILVIETNYKFHKKPTDIYEENELWARIYKNFKNYKLNKNFDPILSNLDINDDIDIEKEENIDENIDKENKIFENKEKKEAPKINIFGPELTSIIQNLLDFRIKIKNVKIIYDDQKTLNYLKNDCFFDDITFGIILEDFIITNEDYKQYMDYSTGIFKNFINLLNFVNESGSASSTDISLLSFKVNRFSFSICYDKPFNLNIPDTFSNRQDGIDLKNKIINNFNKYFGITNKNLLNAFIIKELQIDFLFLFKPNNTIPLQALFIIFNLNNLNLNIEIKHIRTFTDIIAYIVNILNSRPFLAVKPITKTKKEKLKEILKDEYDEKWIKELNSLIIKECFLLYNWTNLYRRILLIKKNKNISDKICKDAFEKSSLLNYLLYKPKNFNENVDFYKIQPKKENDSQIKNTSNANDNLEPNQISSIISKIHFHVRISFNVSINLLKENLNKEISFNIENIIIDLAKWSCKNKFQLKINLKKIDLLYQMEKLDKKKKKDLDIFSLDYSSKIKFKEKIKKEQERIYEIINILIYKGLNLELEFQLENINNDKITIFNCEGSFGEIDLALSPMFLENVFNNINKFYSFHYNKIISNLKYLGLSIPSINIGEISPLFQSYQKDLDRDKKHSVKKLGNLMFSYEFKNLIDKQKKIKEIEKDFQKESILIKNKKSEDDEITDNINLINKKIIEFEKKLQKFALSIKLKTPIFNFQLFNETMDEILKSSFNLGLLQIDMDLKFKEKCMIEAFGLKVESKYPLNSLLPFIKKLINLVETSIDSQIKDMIKFYNLKSKTYLTKQEKEYINNYSKKQKKLKIN